MNVCMYGEQFFNHTHIFILIHYLFSLVSPEIYTGINPGTIISTFFRTTLLYVCGIVRMTFFNCDIRIWCITDTMEQISEIHSLNVKLERFPCLHSDCVRSGGRAIPSHCAQPASLFFYRLWRTTFPHSFSSTVRWIGFILSIKSRYLENG